ncbi:Tn3 family transposase [Streptomyces iranensis]|uniref:Tn3 transposase DDE domain-containing protein n=1 Tax=Streptomyces iranensis TaxID=576784 RepID=A0ABS4N920_9ACTN|nr:Tn3 family transposase [Streptomyces iranensis]MBP2068520.1 hypothetical protein [Streptomyces iranensis]
MEWWRRFGPASGTEPKLIDPFGRYVITTFVKGANLGPYEAARHIPGVSGHEVSLAANRHFSIPTLNEAIADLVNAHARLDISQAWGDGSTAAADGTHMDTYLNNPLSETSVRYGKPGGIAYHHISDTYIALFTHFIPCGVWEAVYTIEGLLKNTSEVKPATVHADTQGQSFPAFALAHLLGFDLMPWSGTAAAAPAGRGTQEHGLHRLPRGRPRHPHRPTAALPPGRPAAPAGDRRDEQGRGIQRLLPVDRLRQRRRHHRQRSRRAGEPRNSTRRSPMR